MSVRTLTIDGQMVSALETSTILTAAQESDIYIPTLCHLEGIADIGACRLCLVEIEGNKKLQPACVTQIVEGMVVHTNTEKLKEYRKMIIELLFAERNHVCAVCVSRGYCELQNLGAAVNMTNVRYRYSFPKCSVDISHEQFGIDHNRCVLCTRCVRVCDSIEGAHTWDIAGRGANSHVITDLSQPWGLSESCTSCGKCVQACPTGAIFRRHATVAEMEKDRNQLQFIVTAREKKQWIA